jgi:hypothetical protein
LRPHFIFLLLLFHIGIHRLFPSPLFPLFRSRYFNLFLPFHHFLRPSFIIHHSFIIRSFIHHSSVRDLRQVYKSMATKDFVRTSRWAVEGASNKKKADLIVLIRKHFYDATNPSIPNRLAMEELGQSQSQSQSQSLAYESPPIAAAAAAAAARPVVFPASASGYQYPQFGMPIGFSNNMYHPEYHPHTLMPSPAAQAAMHNLMQHNRTPTSPMQVSAPAPAPAPAPVPHTNTNTNSNTNVRVKLEHPSGGVDESNHSDQHDDGQRCQPRNPMEMNLLVQLTQIGFSNRREILENIRSLMADGGTSNSDSDGFLSHQQQPPSVDTVMVAMITQREEAEEARKMDEARLQSEQARKEDARRRRSLIHNNAEETLKTASMDDWRGRQDMFPDSWILNENACYALLASLLIHNDNDILQLKGKLMALLKLEKKAKQWYGQVLPRGYFARCVTTRLMQATTGDVMIKNDTMAGKSMATTLRNEVDALQVAMFQLSEQQGGVPRIFLEAHDDSSNTKLEQDGVGSDEQKRGSGAFDTDDDDVVLVGTISSTPPGSARSEKAAGRSEPEVLEIL